MLQPPKPESPKADTLIWWRNWVAVLTVLAAAMLIIVALTGSPLWVFLVVAIGLAFGIRQLVSLTGRSRDD